MTDFQIVNNTTTKYFFFPNVYPHLYCILTSLRNPKPYKCLKYTISAVTVANNYQVSLFIIPRRLRNRFSKWFTYLGLYVGAQKMLCVNLLT